MEKEKKTGTNDSAQSRKIDYKKIGIQLAQTISYNILVGACVAAGGHAYASMIKGPRGKLISINGGKTSVAI
jgi:hypothetical protein